jgi:hypothetical protein
LKRFVVVTLLCLASLASTRTFAGPAKAANSLTFGGKTIAIDLTSCSPDNSADGKSRAIAATNSASASTATLQFATLEPASGEFTTVADEDALGPGKVIVGAAGSLFEGALLAKPGQKVSLVKTGSKYQATFSDLTLIDAVTKAASSKTLTGSVSCQ